MKKIVFVILAFIICSPVFAAGTRDSRRIPIGVSLPASSEGRWVIEHREFVAAAEKIGAEVIVLAAGNNAARQKAQVEELIARGVRALIVAPYDSIAARSFVTLARNANIPIIAYDQPIPAAQNSMADLYVTLDQFELGQLMGRHIWENVPSGNLVFLRGNAADYTVPVMTAGIMSIILPRIDDGTYRIVMDRHIRDWEPAAALSLMEQALAANNNNIQGVIAPDDGTAGAVIQALAAAGLAGRVPVTGQNAELDAVRRIIAGTQSMTISYKGLAEAALEAAINLANRRPSGANAADTDGTPKLSRAPVLITSENYRRELIDTGIIPESDLR